MITALHHTFSQSVTRATPQQGRASRDKFVGTSTAYAFFYKIHNKITRKLFTLKMKVKVTQYNIHNDATPWRMSTAVKIISCIYTTGLTVFEILMFRIYDLENLSQGHRAQHL